MDVVRPRRNRVSPFGDIEATNHKGSLMGNRGDLHAPDGTLGREWRSKRWISCILDGGGWKAPMDAPGHNYPLFFSAEAVALAAGHRPCGECRSTALNSFIHAWKIGHGLYESEFVPLKTIDDHLHVARISERRLRLRGKLINLPVGAFVHAPSICPYPLLVQLEFLIPWSHEGFGTKIDKARVTAIVEILTPSPILRALSAGFEPAMPL